MRRRLECGSGWDGWAPRRWSSVTSSFHRRRARPRTRREEQPPTGTAGAATQKRVGVCGASIGPPRGLRAKWLKGLNLPPPPPHNLFLVGKDYPLSPTTSFPPVSRPWSHVQPGGLPSRVRGRMLACSVLGPRTESM